MPMIPYTSFKLTNRKVLIGKIKELQTLVNSPYSIKNLSHMHLSSTKTDDIANIVSHDPILYINLLRYLYPKGGLDENTNYDFSAVIESLGIENLENFLKNADVYSEFSKFDKNLWRHSYSSFLMMKTIVEQNQLPVSPTLPYTVFLHDIGKVVLKNINPTKHTIAIQKAVQDEVPLHNSEREVMNITHSEAGGILLREWGLPPQMVKPVCAHHMISDKVENIPSEYVLETALLQFVNYIDSDCRNEVTFTPSPVLLQKAGILELDNEFWKNYQRKLLKTLDEENDPGTDIAFYTNTDPKSTLVMDQNMFSNIDLNNTDLKQQQKQMSFGNKTSAKKIFKNLPSHEERKGSKSGKLSCKKVKKAPEIVSKKNKSKPKSTNNDIRNVFKGTFKTASKKKKK